MAEANSSQGSTASRAKVNDPSETATIGNWEHEFSNRKTRPAKFNADSALLRELGERLVGRPHIALAELVKNAFDADATRCKIVIDADRITVTDNGHGMTENEFLGYWMTIGTRNKERDGISRELKRPVTGSKGVGRLAAQFLAHKLQIVTTPKASNSNQLHAFVDWDEAVETGSLTEAVANWRTEAAAAGLYPGRSKSGTLVLLEVLKQVWDETEIRELGRQIWMLNSPDPRFGRTRSRQKSADQFTIEFHTSLPGLDKRFEQQMRQALENHQATIRGEIVRRGKQTISRVTVTFVDDGEPHIQEFAHAIFLSEAEWEVRVYDLSGRQEGGIAVGDMRKYFERYGGVMVYDAGFRLPYYGAQNDWLGLEFDHSHRRSRSELLPPHLQVSRALNDLPTQGRIFGLVHVNTGLEQRLARPRRQYADEFLKIQVSRDRLVGNKAFEVLRDAVRQSIDYYATLKRQRTSADIDFERPREAAVIKLARLSSLVQEARKRYPDDDTIRAIEEETQDLREGLESEGRSEEAVRSLLGPLASTGMVALAMEHEVRRDVRAAHTTVRSLKRVAKELDNEPLRDLAAKMAKWIERLEDTRKILQPMMDDEDRRSVRRLRAEAVVRLAVEHVQPYLGRAVVTIKADDAILLPAATITEWHAVLQNVLLNAGNATVDQTRPLIQVRLFRHGRWAYLHVNDNGTGVDLDDNEELFQPFVRRSAISEERRELGVGGSGLGLTIVEMIATQRECYVNFVEPEPGWATTFEMSWRAGGVE
jgi:signal transduction histidine kinase